MERFQPFLEIKDKKKAAEISDLFHTLCMVIWGDDLF